MYSGSTPILPNNAINSDSKKRRAFVTLPFASGYGQQ
jgi:hypothetical protein